MVVQGDVGRVDSGWQTGRQSGEDRVAEPGSDLYIEHLRQDGLGWKVSSGVGSFRLKVLELRADGKAR